MTKNVMRINRSTTDAFVRGDVGMWELERFRDVAMLEWLGRVLRMGTDRWARRVFDVEWRPVKKGFRSWKWKVEQLLVGYRLQQKLEDWKGGGMEGDWSAEVRRAVFVKALEDWKDAVRAGRKLDLFALVKREWGFENYLGESGKGIVLMSRFRSGSAGVGEELARYGGSGVWNEDGTENNISGVRMCELGGNY